MASRRQFLQTAGAVAGTSLVPSFASANAPGKLVRLSPEIEPLVRLIERTPRNQCVEVLAEQVRRGLPYRQFLAALFMAGIRNVNPQPPGFKFHCVFVIHAAHQVSLDIPNGQRLLPLFWALDNFKASQQKDVQQGDFKLRPVQGKLPSSTTAWREFQQAMADWDEEKADRAIVALARNEGAQAIAERMWFYGARDYRNIGHKAIFTANTWQTLQTIGWHHAEPALRSLVLGLLDFGKKERVNDYAFEDQSYLANVERVDRLHGKLPANWASAKSDKGATRELLQSIRTGKVSESCELAIQQAVGKSKSSSQAVWDAVHLAASELMLQQPGIYGIHTVTSAHGLRYAFDTASSPATRLVMMLQGVGWMCQFRNFMARKPKGLNKSRITSIKQDQVAKNAVKAAEEVFSSVGTAAASTKALAWARQFPNSTDFARRAKLLVAQKATDAHHYKYATSILADAEKVSPEYRPNLYAASVYYLRGSKDQESTAVRRARVALK